MDAIDLMVCFAAVGLIAHIIIQQGTLCAQKVWERTKPELDEIELMEAAHVPYVTNLEALLLFVAATLRAFYQLPIALFNEYRKRPWERTPQMRLVDLELRLGTDILGAVSSMLSGYPERAKHLFWQERGQRLAREYDALLQDYEALSEGGGSLA
ncbi:hypothetical protein [Polaromonas sp. JS666]|uniref:hypothetical protein n=1 Tax=Polaromonas sp. (strain JS666 / ATCC BAA-500) TaxID=296591 RepID=UPI0000464685|nr:hypothetical protein [Polaromonas sp. JS666]ABE47220.1 hypothetical protein Bpro_5364 [Polaromonas sp. JS666]